MLIRTKILLACLSLTAVTLAFGAVTRNAQSQLGDVSIRLYDEAFMSMSYLRSAQNTIVSVSRSMAAGTTDQAELALRLADAIGDLDVARERALSAQGRQAAAWLHDRLVQMSREAEDSHRPPDRKALAELERRFDIAVEINAGDGFHSRRVTAELVNRLSTQTWIAMGVSLAVALAITFLLSRTIVPSVHYAVSIAAAIADGRLDNRIIARGRSGVAILLRALAVMQRSIADKMARIEQLMAEQATSHANEMASQHVRFETALDNMVQGLCMFDDEGQVLVHNRRFGEMFAPVEPGTRADAALPALLLSAREDSAWEQTHGFTSTLQDERTIAVAEKPMAGGGWVAT